MEISSFIAVILYTLVFLDRDFWQKLMQEIYLKNLMGFAIDGIIVMVRFYIVFTEMRIVT